MTRATCASCGAPFIWATTANQRAMPVDAEPSANGNVVLEPRERGAPLARVLKKGEAHDGPLHTSHFATCPGAGQHRRPR